MEYSDGKLWRCANPITECGRVVAEQTSPDRATYNLRCPLCGFEARVRRISPLGSKPEIEELVQRGPVFEAFLSTAYANGESILSLRRKTGMSHCTLALILGDLGYKSKRGGKFAYRPQSHREALVRKRESHRKAFLAYLEANPGATRKSIARNLAAAYQWLTSNDREWYLVHAPTPLESTKTPPWVERA